MLRIHFTGEDLASTRFADGPDPMWEVLLSLYRLRRRDGSVVFGQWRHRELSRLPTSTRSLTTLAPIRGYSVDFLTPPPVPAAFSGGHGLPAQTEALRATPKQRVRNDLTEFARLHPTRQLPSWSAHLADGHPDPLERLADAATTYFNAALAPYWQRIHAQVSGDRMRRSRLLAEGGWAKVFATLHPSARWAYPILELAYPVDQELRLSSRGLVLQPSFFCRHTPTTLLDPNLPPVLTYPIEHELGWAAIPHPVSADSDQRLTRLLGQARTHILDALADGVATTNEVARRTAVAPSTASRHLTALREAGMVTSRRDHNTTLHTITPLGQALLNGRDSHLPA